MSVFIFPKLFGDHVPQAVPCARPGAHSSEPAVILPAFMDLMSSREFLFENVMGFIC